MALFLVVQAEKKLNVYFPAIVKPVSWPSGSTGFHLYLGGVHNKL